MLKGTPKTVDQRGWNKNLGIQHFCTY